MVSAADCPSAGFMKRSFYNKIDRYVSKTIKSCFCALTIVITGYNKDPVDRLGDSEYFDPP